MIAVKNLYKRYQTIHGPGPWVLSNVNLSIPPKLSVGIVGANGAGKSTLLRLIGGTDSPNRGEVKRHCRVSWPMGLGSGLKGSLTGRQNSVFVCRIHGLNDEETTSAIAFIEDFAEIGNSFNEPIHSYSSGMKSRLQFGMSLAFDFDVYISDEVTSTGDAAFQKKARQAFQNLAGRSSLIMASHSDKTLKQFCEAGIFVYQGQVHWFDDIDDAIKAYKKTFIQ
jgi:capsular polysaccharide transport system ATP-binding protein